MDSVQYRLEDGVAFLTLNRPERLNAGSAERFDTLLKLIFRSESDRSVRAQYLTGCGGAFSADFDIRYLPADKGDDEIHVHFRWMAMLWHEVLASLVRSDM